MSGFTDLFGGSPVQPGDVSYRSLTMTDTTRLEWPAYSINSQPLPHVLDVSSGNSAYSLYLPSATLVSPGQDFLIANRGANSVPLVDADGNNLATLAVGTVRYFYLTDNATAAGTWTSILFGVGTASVDASNLAGRGLVARGLLLDAGAPTTSLSASRSIADTDRAALLLWTGAAGTLTLMDNTTVSQFFCAVRNGGTGPLVVAAASGQTIDGVASVSLVPGESAVVHVAQSLGAYTVGRTPQLVLTRTTFAVTGGTRVLTLVEASNVIQDFTGTLGSNQIIEFPAVVQTYFVSNNTSGAFTLTFKTAGAGASVVVPTGQNAVLVCTGTDVINAATTTAGVAALLLGSGSVSNPSLAIGAANTGVFSPAANTLGVAVGGALAATFAGGLTEAIAAGTSELSVRSTGNAATVAASGAAGFLKRLALRTAGLMRWALESTSTAESGADAGSNFVLRSYADDGSVKADVLTVSRATGASTLSGGLTVNGATALTGTLTAASGSTLSGGLTVNGATALTGTLTAASGSTLSGGLTVNGATALAGALTAASGSTLSGGLTVNGATALAGALTVASASTFSGNVNLAASAIIDMGGSKIQDVAPGTATGDVAAWQQLFAQGTPQILAVGATLDVGALQTAFLQVSGSGTNVSSLGTNYNGPRYLAFAGANTLVYNATTLVTPSGTDWSVQAGDVVVVTPKATVSGTPDGWRVVGNAGGSVTPAQLQAQTYTAFTTGGSGSTYTLTPTPALTAYLENQEFDVEFHTASSGTPTLNVSGLGVKSLQWYDSAGTLGSVGTGVPSGFRSRVVYDGTNMVVRDRPPVVTGVGTGVSLAAGVLSVNATPGTRQTVLSGPLVAATGAPDFGGSTGSTTVTASAALVVSAAQGASDRVGSITNPSWTGLSAVSTTYYLYLEVAGDGTCSTGSTAQVPGYTPYATYSTTSDAHVFCVPEMTMKVGNGATSAAVWRVFVGEAATGGGGTVTSITWYAVRGMYASGLTTCTAGLEYTYSHNLGVTWPFIDSKVFIVPKTTTENSYAPFTSANPDYVELGSETNARLRHRLRTTSYLALSNSISLAPVGGGAPAAVSTPANWWLQANFQRTF